MKGSYFLSSPSAGPNEMHSKEQTQCDTVSCVATDALGEDIPFYKLPPAALPSSLVPGSPFCQSPNWHMGKFV